VSALSFVMLFGIFTSDKSHKISSKFNLRLNLSLSGKVLQQKGLERGVKMTNAQTGWIQYAGKIRLNFEMLRKTNVLSTFIFQVLRTIQYSLCYLMWMLAFSIYMDEVKVNNVTQCDHNNVFKITFLFSIENLDQSRATSTINITIQYNQ